MKEYLFSYGTLQKKEVQIELFGKSLSGSRDILRAHTLAEIEIEDEAFLSRGEKNRQLTLVKCRDQNAVVEGMTFEIETTELVAADKYEPAEYRRVRVNLESGKQAWVYMRH